MNITPYRICRIRIIWLIVLAIMSNESSFRDKTNAV